MAKEINFVRPQEVYEDGLSTLQYRGYDGTMHNIGNSANLGLKKEIIDISDETIIYIAFSFAENLNKIIDTQHLTQFTRIRVQNAVTEDAIAFSVIKGESMWQLNILADDDLGIEESTICTLPTPKTKAEFANVLDTFNRKSLDKSAEIMGIPTTEFVWMRASSLNDVFGDAFQDTFVSVRRARLRSGDLYVGPSDDASPAIKISFYNI